MELGTILSAFLPVWLPIVAAPVVYLLRRQAAWAALLSSAVVAVAGWWLVAHPPGQALTLLGRNIFLGDTAQLLLVGLAFWLVIAFLFASRISQGWSLFPFLLMVYALITMALFFEEFILRVLILKIAWLVVILLVQGGTANTRAATRLLILSVLALPPFLVAATLIGQRLYQPEATDLTALIVLALGMGFSLMLAVIPFHAWLPQAAEDGPPLIAAWLAAGMGSSYLVLLFDLLGRYQWLAGDEQLQRFLLGGGILLAVGGGILAVTEHHLGRLWAYTVLVDLGYILLGLSFGTRAGMMAALLTIGSRLLSLLLAGSALATIRHRATTLDFDDLLGVGAKLPLSMLALAVGGMAMLGVPLTAGFPGHLAVLQLVAEMQGTWAWLLILASFLGFIGFCRAFAVMMSTASESQLARVEGEPRFATALLLCLVAVSVWIGIVPQSLDPILVQLLRSLNF